MIKIVLLTKNLNSQKNLKVVSQLLKQKKTFSTLNAHEEPPLVQQNIPQRTYDLECDEFSPLQNSFIYNNEQDLRYFMHYDVAEDTEEGSTIFYGLQNQQSYLEGFCSNDSLGSIQQNLQKFIKKNNISNTKVVDLEESEFPSWESLDKMKTPVKNLKEYIYTVSDYTDLEHYGQKFSILEYEIIAFTEKIEGETLTFFEWVPMTVVQTELKDGSMINLKKIEDPQQEKQIFQQLLADKNIFPKNMKAAKFFDEFSETKTYKKDFSKQKNIEKIPQYFKPGSVIKAFKGSYSEVGVYLSPDKVILVNTDSNSKIQDLKLGTGKKSKVLEHSFNEEKIAKLQKEVEQQEKQQQQKEQEQQKQDQTSATNNANEENKEQQQKEQQQKEQKPQVQEEEEVKNTKKERKREEEQKGFFDRLFSNTSSSTKDTDAHKKEMLYKMLEKRNNQRRGKEDGQPIRRDGPQRRTKANNEDTSRFLKGLLAPSVDTNSFRVVSFQDFIRGASEIRQTSFSYQPYTVQELEERMKYLNKNNASELNELYSSYQAFYLAIGYKASPVHNPSALWWHWVNSKGVKRNLFLAGLLFAGILLVPETRNRVFKYGRRLKRNFEKAANTKIVFGNNSQEQQHEHSYKHPNSFAEKLKQAQIRAKQNENNDEEDSNSVSALDRKQSGMAEQLKETYIQQQQSEDINQQQQNVSALDRKEQGIADKLSMHRQM